MLGDRDILKELKPGTKVVFTGEPYYNSTKRGTVISSPYPRVGGGHLVAIRSNIFQRFVVNTNKVLSVKENQVKLSKPAIVTGVILSVFALLVLIGIGNYNGLVSSRAAVDNSWGKVETQYQRRLDLIDNLVASVKGSQLQEQKVFGDIANARKQYSEAKTPDQQTQAASSLETNIALIPRLQEAYPELKSNQNVQALMGQLTGTEDGIRVARDEFNNTATNYNVQIQRFPKSIFAGMFSFEQRSLFKAASGAEKAPKVKF